jgi:hypothetical protein
VAGARDKKVQALRMPGAPGGHPRTFNKCDYIVFNVCVFKRSEIAVQVIKGDVDQLRHALRVNVIAGFCPFKSLLLEAGRTFR